MNFWTSRGFLFCLHLTTKFSSSKLLTQKKMLKGSESYLLLRDTVPHLALASLPKFFISKENILKDINDHHISPKAL